jgi:hypothetical protein
MPRLLVWEKDGRALRIAESPVFAPSNLSATGPGTREALLISEPCREERFRSIEHLRIYLDMGSIFRI